MEALPTNNNVELIGDGYSGLSQKEQAALICRDKLVGAKGTKRRNDIEMAFYLLEAQEEGYDKYWGKTLVDFVEEVLDTSYRMAQHAITVARFIRDQDISIEEATNIGLTKMSFVERSYRHRTDAGELVDIEELLELAANSTKVELEEHLKMLKPTEEKNAPRDVDSSRYAFRLTGVNASIVDTAMGAAAAMLGTNRDAESVLALMAGQWMALYDSNPSHVSLEAWKEVIEKTFKVRLEVCVDDDNINDVLGGSKKKESTMAAVSDLKGVL